MKVLMYHYVRPATPDLPYFRYLHEDDFAVQLDALSERYQIVGPADFLGMLSGEPVPEDAVLLTFDDGLRDHFDHVLPILAQRGVRGVFFVLTGPLSGRKVFHVHRTHHLLGRHGGSDVLSVLERELTSAMINEGKKDIFQNRIYLNQTNDQATQSVKKILNYFVSEPARDYLLDMIEDELGLATPAPEKIYLSEDQLREMQKQGHLVASHGVTHRVLRTLSEADQRAEISQSFQWLEETIGDSAVRIFCYPYGGRDTFDHRTTAILQELGCLASFAVEPRPVQETDLRASPFALPRFDCNMFPYGAASLGGHRAAGRSFWLAH